MKRSKGTKLNVTLHLKSVVPGFESRAGDQMIFTGKMKMKPALQTVEQAKPSWEPNPSYLLFRLWQSSTEASDDLTLSLIVLVACCYSSRQPILVCTYLHTLRPIAQ